MFDYPLEPEHYPTHYGWMGIVPVWLWNIDPDYPEIMARFFLSQWSVRAMSALQVAACNVLGVEPYTHLAIKPMDDRRRHMYQIEAWIEDAIDYLCFWRGPRTETDTTQPEEEKP